MDRAEVVVPRGASLEAKVRQSSPVRGKKALPSRERHAGSPGISRRARFRFACGELFWRGGAVEMARGEALGAEELVPSLPPSLFLSNLGSGEITR